MTQPDTIDQDMFLDELKDLLVPEHRRAKPDRAFLSEDNLADRLGMTKRKVADMRRIGEGPRFIQLTKNTIIYSVKSVLEWEGSLKIYQNDGRELPNSETSS